MRIRLGRAVTAAFVLLLGSPTIVHAHAGHAGDHGWLVGAVQPLMSPDHLARALVIMALVGGGIVLVGRIAAGRPAGHFVDGPSPRE